MSATESRWPRREDSSTLSVPLPTPDILSRVCGNVFARGGQVQHTPLSADGFDEIISKHVPLVYKPHALEQFSRLLGCPYPMVLRRPHGFGLDTFVSMLSAWLDLDYDANNDPFKALMGPVVGLHSSYILELDFNRIRGSKDVRAKLSKYISAHSRALLQRYGLTNKIPWLDAEKTPNLDLSEYILRLAVRLAGLPPPLRGPLFVIIRNFDELAYGYIDGPKVLNEFLRFVELDVMTRKVDGVLLVSTRNDGTIEHCRGRAPGGPMPSYPALYRLELERTLDLSHHPAFQTAAGFTADEIEDLDRALEAGVGTGNGSRSKSISSPPVLHRVKNGYTWGALFADSNWFTAQKTWTRSWRQGNGDDPSTWLQTLSTDDDEDIAVYCARDVMELLREKYGFPLTCEPWFES